MTRDGKLWKHVVFGDNIYSCQMVDGGVIYTTRVSSDGTYKFVFAVLDDDFNLISEADILNTAYTSRPSNYNCINSKTAAVYQIYTGSQYEYFAIDKQGNMAFIQVTGTISNVEYANGAYYLCENVDGFDSTSRSYYYCSNFWRSLDGMNWNRISTGNFYSISVPCNTGMTNKNGTWYCYARCKDGINLYTSTDLISFHKAILPDVLSVQKYGLYGWTGTYVDLVLNDNDSYTEQDGHSVARVYPGDIVSSIIRNACFQNQRMIQDTGMVLSISGGGSTVWHIYLDNLTFSESENNFVADGLGMDTGNGTIRDFK